MGIFFSFKNEGCLDELISNEIVENQLKKKHTEVSIKDCAKYYVQVTKKNGNDTYQFIYKLGLKNNSYEAIQFRVNKNSVKNQNNTLYKNDYTITIIYENPAVRPFSNNKPKPTCLYDLLVQNKFCAFLVFVLHSYKTPGKKIGIDMKIFNEDNNCKLDTTELQKNLNKLGVNISFTGNVLIYEVPKREDQSKMNIYEELQKNTNSKYYNDHYNKKK
jgi:hypothetical protein